MLRIWKERLARLLFEEDVYSIGIRRRTDQLLHEGNKASFSMMTITRHEWYADPLIFPFQGKDYLFCEVFDRDTNKGSIAVTQLDSCHPEKPHVVLDIETHLSYPCVFQLDNEVYMIPETTTLQNVMLFRAKNFPDEWELVREIMNGVEFADTTVFQTEKRTYLFTFEQYQGNGSIVKVRAMEVTQGLDKTPKQISVQDDSFSDQLRGGGGYFFLSNGVLMRPAQDCAPYYGYALNFMQVDSLYPTYKEHFVTKITPADIEIDIDKKIKGIHTYTLCDDYEVIDIKFTDVVFVHQVRRLFSFIKRRIRKEDTAK